MSVPLKWADSVPVPVLTAKAYRGSGGIGPLTLKLDTRRELHTPAALPPGEEIRYPLYRRLGGPQGWSGLVRKILPTPGFDP